jgi:hypothetical protein
MPSLAVLGISKCILRGRGREGVITQTLRVRLSRNELFTQFHQASRGDRKFVCFIASFIVLETLSKSTNGVPKAICYIDASFFYRMLFVLYCTLLFLASRSQAFSVESAECVCTNMYNFIFVFVCSAYCTALTLRIPFFILASEMHKTFTKPNHNSGKLEKFIINIKTLIQ